MVFRGRTCALVWTCAWLWTCACASSSPFRVYWNVPTQLCARYGVNVNVSQYGLIQNAGDAFHGEKVTILYGPGAFPYLKEGKGGWSPVNGGIPQAGSLATHVQTFINTLNQLVPLDFEGAAVLDFEDYYPGLLLSPVQYKEASRAWVRARHPSWSPAQVDEESYVSFNTSAKDFFKSLLWVGRELRPRALWGYYHYPYCHDYSPGEGVCRGKTQDMNNELGWLYEGSAALYPSLYVFRESGYSPRSRRQHAAAQLGEAWRMKRMVNSTAPILPYLWYRYHDSPAFLTPVDFVNTLGLARMVGTGGAVVWGSSKDVQTEGQCLALKSYAEGQVGPLVRYLVHLPSAKLRRTLASRGRLRRGVKTVLRGANRVLRKGRGRWRRRKGGGGGGGGGGDGVEQNKIE